MSDLSKKEYKDKYDDFIKNKEIYLHDFRVLIGKEDPFTFSKEEIEEVDDFFRANKEKFSNEKPIYSEFEKYFYAYFGIAFINKYGGDWDISTDKKDAAFGTPIIWHEAKNYRLATNDWIHFVKEDSPRRISFFFRLDKLISYKLDDD